MERIIDIDIKWIGAEEMQLLQDLAIVLARIVTLFPLLLAMGLYMGKRSIGELPIFDFIVIATLANITGADIADPSINHIHTGFAIVVVALIQKIVSTQMIKKRKFGKLITFEPTMVISDGQLLIKNLKKINYSIDNILQGLREKDIFDISDVQLAIIEANGKLSVHKKGPKSGVTLEDLSLVKKSSGLAYPVVIDGVIDENMLHEFQLTKTWLLQELYAKGIPRLSDVFFASINTEKQLHISLIHTKPTNPPFHH